MAVFGGIPIWLCYYLLHAKVVPFNYGLKHKSTVALNLGVGEHYDRWKALLPTIQPIHSILILIHVHFSSLDSCGAFFATGPTAIATLV